MSISWGWRTVCFRIPAQRKEGTLDEERRLFYVAITRAMQTLSISHCGGRKRYGQMMPCHPSPFLKELPGDLLELADEKAKQPVTVNSGKSMFDAITGGSLMSGLAYLNHSLICDIGNRRPSSINLINLI